MGRREFLVKLLQNIDDKVCIITSLGMISREVYDVKDRVRNFYCQGAMGASIAIGCGLAFHRSDLEVVVISGDGESLIGLGGFVLHKKLGLSNLTHYILDNNCHATTGGQPTASDAVDFEKLAPNTHVFKVSGEKGDAPRIPLTCKQIGDRFREAICKQEK